MAQRIFPNQQGPITIPAVIRIIEEMLPATLIGVGLLGSDSIPIDFSIDNGLTGEAASQDGAVIALTLLNNVIAINSPITLRLVKPTTVGLAAVFIAAAQEV